MQRSWTPAASRSLRYLACLQRIFDNLELWSALVFSLHTPAIKLVPIAAVVSSSSRLWSSVVSCLQRPQHIATHQNHDCHRLSSAMVCNSWKSSPGPGLNRSSSSICLGPTKNIYILGPTLNIKSWWLYWLHCSEFEIRPGFK